MNDEIFTTGCPNLASIELAQCLSILTALEAHLKASGSLHLFAAGDRIGVRVVSHDGTPEETVESVTGATLRDALAQAAQVTL